jgi:hypothetical protein
VCHLSTLPLKLNKAAPPWPARGVLGKLPPLTPRQPSGEPREHPPSVASRAKNITQHPPGRPAISLLDPHPTATPLPPPPPAPVEAQGWGVSIAQPNIYAPEGREPTRRYPAARGTAMTPAVKTKLGTSSSDGRPNGPLLPHGPPARPPNAATGSRGRQPRSRHPTQTIPKPNAIGAHLPHNGMHTATTPARPTTTPCLWTTEIEPSKSSC